MLRMQFSQLFLLLALISQALCTLPCALQRVNYGDGSFGWACALQVSSTPRDITAYLKQMSQEAYDEMKGQARGSCPSVMAVMFLPTQQGGLLSFSSSIKGAPRGKSSVATAQFSDGQHKHGNCAEMHGLAALERNGIQTRGGYVAAYGLQGQREKWMAPCLDSTEEELWGCTSFCRQYGLSAVTSNRKRSMRIEGKSSLDAGEMPTAN